MDASASAKKLKKEKKEKVEKDYVIEPELTTPKIDTSKWPLLLKNYDQLHVRPCLSQ
jgi:H/ACA ribonucleoprotein complex subunit 4